MSTNTKKLTIGILDFNPILMKKDESRITTPEIQMLKKAIEDRGHTTQIMPVDRYLMFYHDNTFDVIDHNASIQNCDVIIPRVEIANRLEAELSILKQIELMGVPVVNKYEAIMVAKNKLRTIQVLSKKNIPVPKTVFLRKFEYLDHAIESIGGYPVILKSAFGSFGCGVIIMESRRSLNSALDFIIERIGTNFLILQEFIAEAEGADLRVFVINGKVEGCMMRQAKEGEFRSNLELGGEAQIVEMTEEEKDVALRAAHAVGLQIAGVDILRSKKGPLVMEVNSNPGFKGLTQITGKDIAGKIVDYAIEFAAIK